MVDELPKRDASFRIAGMEGYFPSGLFVLVSGARESDVESPTDTKDLQLTFCGVQGALHPVGGLKNPWPLADWSGEGSAARKEQKPLQFVELPYFFLTIAHPSLEVATQYLDLARTSPGERHRLPWQKLAPRQENGRLVFLFSGDVEKYVPQGHSRYGKWCLYYRMPHGRLVSSHISKLGADLSKMGYPSGGLTSGQVKQPLPYPGSADEHGGEFGTMTQACLHKFQLDTKARHAARVQASGVPWACVKLTKARCSSMVEENGVVDWATGAAIEEWLSKGLVQRGEPLVEYLGHWGNQRLWWRYIALEQICGALGGLYPPLKGSSYRSLGAAGAGQALLSKHKLGMAVDLNGYFAEPAASTPFGVEADWIKKGKVFTPYWLLFIHSSFDERKRPEDLEDLRAGLKACPGKIRAELEQQLGKEIGEEAEGFLRLVESLVSELSALSSRQGKNGATGLSDEFFRTSIRRFQWREDSDDGGTVQEGVTAQQDAEANQVRNGKDAKSWMNYTRLAYRLELDRISARSDFDAKGFEAILHAKQKQKGKAIDTAFKLKPAASPARTQKAVDLDRIADHIDSLQAGERVQIYGPDDPAFFIGSAKVDAGGTGRDLGDIKNYGYPKEDFDLETMRNWIRRPSDDPDELPPATEGFDYASNVYDKKKLVRHNGLDLRIRVLFTVSGKAAQQKFLKSRENLKVKVMGIGSALSFDKAPPAVGQISRLADIRGLLESARPQSPTKAESGDFRSDEIWLRPMLMENRDFVGKGGTAEDPGRFYFLITPQAEPKSLEWWHYELRYAGADWITRADALGLARSVIEAPAFPSRTESSAIPQGGMGATKTSNYGAQQDPKNRPEYAQRGKDEA